MQRVAIGSAGLVSTRIVYGCMRLAGDGSAAARQQAFAALDAALEAGIRHFDHADIYGNGAAEALFGEWLRANPGLRDDILLTSKCGVRFAGSPAADSPKRYDLSAAHIRASVTASLERLQVDYLDLLLLHRPDALFEVDEITAVFDDLRAAGQARHFGVSNFSASQASLLQSRLDVPLVANQLELSLRHPDPLFDGTVDWCREHGLAVQAWSPLGGAVDVAGTRPNVALQTELDRLARAHDTDRAGIALKWLLRHPAQILPIIGSLQAARIRSAFAASRDPLSREDWYRLLEARRGQPCP